LPTYRVHRMKDNPRQQFRWAPHTIGMTVAKQKDYEMAFEAEAASPYALWLERKDAGQPLEVGDIVESETGELRIYKYVGFEEAQWQVPEIKPSDSANPSTGTGAEPVSPASPAN
jgi:hypothetical protein